MEEEVKLNNQQRNLVISCLTDLSFVNWDRFLDMSEDGHRILKIYGWIHRKKDSYKDFIVLNIYLDDLTISYITSSEKFTKKIQLLLYGTSNKEHHSECIRVESRFNIPNCIKIGGRHSSKPYRELGIMPKKL